MENLFTIASWDKIGCIFSILAIYLSIRVNIWTWPVGIVSIVIKGCLYYASGIYAHAILEIGYLAIGLYGWYAWLATSSKITLPIQTLNGREMFFLTIIGTLTSLIIYYLLIQYTDSTIAALDAIITTLALTAVCLKTRKIILCWPIWILADVLYIGVLVTKGLPYTALYHVLYIFMGMMGIYHWQKKMSPSAKPLFSFGRANHQALTKSS